jgi:hypothetical protein
MKKNNRTIRVLAAVAASLTLATTALATPVSYSFTTGPSLLPTGPVSLFGTTVTGSFTYDADAPLTASDPSFGFAYNGAFSQLSGSAAGFSFTDPLGFAVLQNDTFELQPGTPLGDILQFSAEPDTLDNLVGFTVDGYTLTNVRLFWIENPLLLANDFLDSTDLPGSLPDGMPRLALDFVNEQGAIARSFYDGVVITQQPASVPEPATGALFAASLAAMALARRKHRRA